MIITGVGRNEEEARDNAWAQARKKGLVILTTGKTTYQMGEWEEPDVFTIEATAVRPGWLMRDAKKAAKRAKQFATDPRGT